MVSCRFSHVFPMVFPFNDCIVAAAVEAPEPTEQEMPSVQLDAQTAVSFAKASFSWSIEVGTRVKSLRQGLGLMSQLLGILDITKTNLCGNLYRQELGDVKHWDVHQPLHNVDLQLMIDMIDMGVSSSSWGYPWVPPSYGWFISWKIPSRNGGNHHMYIYICICIYVYIHFTLFDTLICMYTSSTAQGGGGSFRIGNL